MGLTRWTGLAVAATALALGAGSVGATVASGAPRSVVGPYFVSPFRVTKLRYAFGQDPAWARDDQILSAQYDSAGISQIYRAHPDGSDQVCLTCKTVEGPNGLPQERPEGDWIMFESFGEQPAHLGAPGLGGYGGDLYVMRPDGSHPYRLTTNSDPNDGAVFTASAGVPYDNFHAYWSPDGRQIIWTHTEANPLAEGGQTWSILLADFRVRHGRPALTDVRVVAKPFGAYETQPWSPDGKGFLLFASGGYRSPFQATPPGWGNARVYYMRLYGAGASPAHPRVTLIGDNAPYYEEQAVFTPDMKDVVMMSNRGATLGSWYDLVAAAAQRTAFDAPDTGTTQTLQFLADFDGTDFRADLYAVDGATGAIRRLTSLDRVIPEFYWDHDYTQLVWSLGGSQATPTYTAHFEGVAVGERAIPKRTPRWLEGEPVEMSRVGVQAQRIRDPGPTTNVSIGVGRPTDPAPGFPHATKSSDHGTVPAVLGSYFGSWQSDLEELGARAGLALTTNLLGRLGIS
jgi:WD40-like Beta Propeller Repeat